MTKQLQVRLPMLTADDQRYDVVDLGAQLASDLPGAALATIIGFARYRVLDAVGNANVVCFSDPLVWARFCSKSCKASRQSRDGVKNYELSKWERDQEEHEQIMFDSTTSHGQDGKSGV